MYVIPIIMKHVRKNKWKKEMEKMKKRCIKMWKGNSASV